eukprot:scaffold285_cov330-Pavlova_lutheri.AAC.108
MERSPARFFGIGSSTSRLDTYLREGNRDPLGIGCRTPIRLQSGMNRIGSTPKILPFPTVESGVEEILSGFDGREGTETTKYLRGEGEGTEPQHHERRRMEEPGSVRKQLWFERMGTEEPRVAMPTASRRSFDLLFWAWRHLHGRPVHPASEREPRKAVARMHLGSLLDWMTTGRSSMPGC